MSIESRAQGVLPDRRRMQERREQALDGGARYRSPPTADPEDAGENLAYDKDCCQNCGRTVRDWYRRAQGDNNGVLWHCGGEDGCTTQSAMKNGAGAMPDYERRCENTGTLGGGL